MSPAQDAGERVIDLADVLDLRAPGRYLVRVRGDELRGRGVLDGDVLVVDATRRPRPGSIAILFVAGEVLAAELVRGRNGWGFRLRDRICEIGEDSEVWALAAALVRTSL